MTDKPASVLVLLCVRSFCYLERVTKKVFVRARSVGDLVPELLPCARGTVRSVHQSVVNILVPSGSGPPVFISVLQHERDRTDLSLLVSDPTDWDIVRTVSPEVTVRFADENIEIAGSPNTTVIETAGSASWSGRVGAVSSRVDPGHRAELVIESLVQSGTVFGGFFPLLLGKALDPFAKRASAILDDAVLIANAERLSALVGLGIGFTPSGDDFLAGLFLAFAASGTEVPTPLREAVAEATHRTTTGGATLLFLVMRGRFPAYQLHFLDGLWAATTPEEFQSVLAELQSHGETSGTDMLCGFCWPLLNGWV